MHPPDSDHLVENSMANALNHIHNIRLLYTALFSAPILVCLCITAT